MSDVDVRPSGIDGLGVFAIRSFSAGDRIRRVNVVREVTEVFDEGVTYLLARRNIAAGTEITCDYNINIANGTAWPCRCGAVRCRGEVVGDFFRLPRQWQREYRPLLAAWFVRQQRECIEALDREP